MANIAAAGGNNRGGGLNLVAVALQAAAMYYLYRTWFGGGAARTSSGGGNAVAGGVSEFDAPHGDVSPFALPRGRSAAPAATAAASAPPSLFEMVGLPDPMKSRTVTPPELAVYEEERAAALAALPYKTALRNLWPNGQAYDLYVFLSTSPAPILSFDRWSEAPASDVESVGVAAAGEGASQGLFSAFGGLRERVLGSQPVRRLRNATFSKLLDGDSAGREEGGDVDGDGVSTALIWAQHGLTYDFADGSAREQSFNVSLPPAVLLNRTGLYAHAYFVVAAAAASSRRLGGAVPPSLSPSDRVIRLVAPLIVYLNKKPVKATYSLLGGDGAGGDGNSSSGEGAAPRMAWGIGAATARPAKKKLESDVDADGASATAPAADDGASVARILPYWRPTLCLELVHDLSVYGVGALPPQVSSTLTVQRRAGGGQPGYTPLAWVNTFWILGHHLIAVNESTAAVPLTLSVAPTAMWKWAMANQMTNQWAMQDAIGGSRDGESDMMKSILMETNPVLLAVTVVVTTLHTLFEFLAFKNDVSFWRSAKSLEGVSVRTLALSAFSQLVILLYLFDNETSYMVLFSATIGVVIEFWKLRKAVSVSVRWENGWPSLAVQDVAEAGYAASRTKEYDERAMSHLLICVYPLLVGYAAYSLLYERHRGWYSWLITSLTGFIYTFGFIQMTPQLYINYRLKSTVALPFRPMMYKALNTVIDDLFSFIVKMPMMHRLACFRDDVIFIVLLYQRWIYPVDKSRRNEFGASGEDYEAAALRKAGGGHRAPRRGKLEKRPLAVTAQ